MPRLPTPLSRTALLIDRVYLSRALLRCIRCSSLPCAASSALYNLWCADFSLSLSLFLSARVRLVVALGFSVAWGVLRAVQHAMRENPLAFIVGRVLHRHALPFKPVRVLSVDASFGKRKMGLYEIFRYHQRAPQYNVLSLCIRGTSLLLVL